MIIRDVNLETVWRDQQAAGEYTAGVCICGQVQCGKIILINALMNRKAYARTLLAAGQNPDHQF